MNARAARFVVAVAAPVALVVIGLVPLVAWWHRLPPRLATHFDLSGRADGSMTRGADAAVLTALIVVCSAVLVVIGARRRPGAGSVAAAALAALLGFTFAGADLSTTLANLDHADWRQVPGPSWWVIVLVVAGGIGAGALVGAAAGAFAAPAEVPAPGPALDLPAGGRAAWHGRLGSRWAAVTSTLAAAAGLALVVIGPARWLGGTLVVVAAAVSTLSTVSVTADGGGLTLRYGLVGVPRQRVPIERIASARAIDVRPMQWAGWGYRGSLAVLRRAALVLRSGPGLRLDLRDGKVFVVTLDHPEIPAAVLNHAARAVHRAP